MPGIIDRFRQMLAPRQQKTPFKEQGVGGFSVYGGYIQTPETNSQLIGSQRWRTAADILCNISIVAASVRYYLNLLAKPAWSFEAADESAAAQEVAELMESIFYDAGASWTRIVRRSGMFKFHGFGMQEWTAKHRDDGRIGIESIEPRPVHTIERWDIDENGGVLGVWQRAPQTGHEIYLPRAKIVYLVDDALTDNPEGMGWFRHLVDPANRIKKYLKLEAMGFERDLSGIPVGRAPIAILNQLVASGDITQAQANDMIKGLKDFAKMETKESTTGLVLDSSPYRAKTDTGETLSSTMQWGMELLTGEATSIQHLGEAVNRLAFDMALIMGTESLLIGREGAGSMALSKDKSQNLWLGINSTLADMAESFDRDIVTPIMAMNGIPEELRPETKVGDVSFQDIEMIGRVLADMSSAGAILAPDDPAIDDLRDLMGISRQPEMTPERAGMLVRTEPATDPLDTDDDPPAGIEKRLYPGARTAKAAPRTLYVQRKLINAAEFIAWAKAQGFETTTPDDDLHVTVTFSKRPVDWMMMGQGPARLVVPEGGPRLVEPLGDKGAVVLLFSDPVLTQRHDEMMDEGASWDFPSYQPHVTISYQTPAGLDLAKVEPYTGALIFGPELFSEVIEDWEKGISEE